MYIFIHTLKCVYVTGNAGACGQGWAQGAVTGTEVAMGATALCGVGGGLTAVTFYSQCVLAVPLSLMFPLVTSIIFLNV